MKYPPQTERLKGSDLPYLGPVTNNTPEQRVSAARFIQRKATSPEDALELLNALGLVAP